jgi:hypothetical protein
MMGDLDQLYRRLAGAALRSLGEPRSTHIHVCSLPEIASCANRNKLQTSSLPDREASSPVTNPTACSISCKKGWPRAESSDGGIVGCRSSGIPITVSGIADGHG